MTSLLISPGEPFETHDPAGLVANRVYRGGLQPNRGARRTVAVSAEAGKRRKPDHSLHTVEPAGPDAGRHLSSQRLDACRERHRGARR